MTFFDYPDSGTAPDPAPARDVAVLAGCSDREWAAFKAQCTREVVRAGQPLIRAGVVDRSLYVVLDGAFAARRADGSTSAPMRAGEVVGEVAFFDGAPRSAGVIALEDSQVLHLGFAAFESLAATEPALARRLLMDLGRSLAGRLRAAESGDR